MDANVEAISTPEYFASTWGATPEQAATLAQQAQFVSRNGGGGITAEAPRAPAPSPTALSAQAEWDQNMAARTAGEITTAEWNGKVAARMNVLADLIANGNGARPAPAAQSPADTHPYLGAPASPNDYGLLFDVGDLPAEQVAEIHAQQDALARLDLKQSVVQDVNSRLRSYAAELEHATPEQVRDRVQQNYERFTKQCAREGIDPARAEALIGGQFKEWALQELSLRPLLESIVEIGDPTILDYVLQIALHKAGRR
jgi:hypothetical protein